MKLHDSAPSALNTFSGYGEGFVLVNGRRHEHPVIVTQDHVVPWSATRFDALTAADFEPFLEMDMEIVLIGTGEKQRFPNPRLTAALLEKRVGVEAMDLKAACRTYNILMAEHRRVGAGLLFR